MLFASIVAMADHYLPKIATNYPVGIFLLHYRGKLRATLDSFANSAKHTLGRFSDCAQNLSVDLSSKQDC